MQPDKLPALQHFEAWGSVLELCQPELPVVPEERTRCIRIPDNKWQHDTLYAAQHRGHVMS